MLLKTKALLALGIMVSVLASFSVANIEQISVTNYLVSLEVENKTPIGCIIHDAYAEIYDNQKRHIANAWIVIKDVEMGPRGTASLLVEIELLIPASELDDLRGNVRVETAVEFSIWLYRGTHESVNRVPVQSLRKVI